MDLGLDQLTDDQLIALVREICQEVSGRNRLAQDALRAAILDESEKHRIATVAAQAEAAKIAAEERTRVATEAASRLRAEAEKKLRDEASAKQQMLWDKKRKLAATISDAARWPWSAQLNIWSRDGEVRVYLQGGSRRTSAEACLYYTGNRNHPPFHLDGHWPNTARVEEIQAALTQAGREWKPGLRLDIPAYSEVQS